MRRVTQTAKASARAASSSPPLRKRVKREGRPGSPDQPAASKVNQTQATPAGSPPPPHKHDAALADKKYSAYSPYTNQSPFPDFGHPTPKQCADAHTVLSKLHSADVAKEFEDEFTPESIPHVLDSIIVAILSQATGWSNAKRAMASMVSAYGSVFAYDAIVGGGREKLEGVLRCGGMQVRKSMMIMTILDQVNERYGGWDMDSMFKMSDEEAMKELLSFKYVGTKSASVVLGWCLKRKPFTVDTHVYRITGLWGWRPATATREKTQSHLEIMIPSDLKFDLHFLFIAHGRTCPACRGGSKSFKGCTAVAAGLEIDR
ncbi:base excision DNA repair protein [Dioszegia hungarica]|uniref:Base excision DNA repair protein n=1 Tax=Dioszegia hungarica TaxID=4972 RepID=A0AA38LX09_9TREE|nr:base excision DNA repair protein [Dioszegia hungarica]KAI9639060.1 base excision DNA repair protein [Dioszegia hungarica]